jgi:hypothetical protein
LQGLPDLLDMKSVAPVAVMEPTNPGAKLIKSSGHDGDLL